MKLEPAPSVTSEEEQEFLGNLAIEMVAMLEDTERALAKKYDEQLFDVDEGLAMWDLLPAKVKTAIKRGREGPKAVCSECGLSGTHIRHCSIGGRFT